MLAHNRTARPETVRTFVRTAVTVRRQVKATNPKKEAWEFFGKKNLKGLYKENPLAFTPDYAKFQKLTYLSQFPIRRENMRGNKVIWADVLKKREVRERTAYKPFPQNEFCQTNFMITDNVKKNIIEDAKNGKSVQALSFTYRIAVPRIEAILKLHEIEAKWEAEVSFSFFFLSCS